MGATGIPAESVTRHALETHDAASASELGDDRKVGYNKRSASCKAALHEQCVRQCAITCH